MADELNFRITASDEATPVMDKVQAEKAQLEEPVNVPLVAPNLAELEEQLAAVKAELAAVKTELSSVQQQAGKGLGSIAEQGEKAAVATGAIAKNTTTTTTSLFRLAQVGAGTGIALGGITDRAIAAAASLALMGSEFFPLVAGIGALVVSMHAVDDAFGVTERMNENTQRLAASLGTAGDTVGVFSDRIHDLAHDSGSLPGIFRNIQAIVPQALNSVNSSLGISERDFDAAAKAMQAFDDVMKDSPAAALQLVQALNQIEANGKSAGENIGIGADKLEEMNRKVVDVIESSAAEADNQAKLKDIIGVVTAARIAGIDAMARQGETADQLIARLQAEMLVTDQVSQHQAELAEKAATAAAIRETAAATFDVVAAAELRGLDAAGQTVEMLGQEVAAYQGVTLAMENLVDATVAQKQAQEAGSDLAAARLEAAKLGLEVSGLGADATNRAILAAGELNQIGKETVESAALQAAAKKKLADAETLWTRAVMAGIDPANTSSELLKRQVEDAEAYAKVIEDSATAQGRLNREFEAGTSIASDYAVDVAEVALSNSRAADEQQLVNEALEDGIDPTMRSADALRELVDQHDELQRSNDQLISSLEELDTSWVKIRDDVGGVEDDADAFGKAWAQATEKVFGLADTFDDVTTAVAKLVAEEKKHGASLDANTISGNKQLTGLEAIRKKIGVDLAEAYRNSGGDLTKLRERGDFWSEWLDKNLPKDLDTAAKGVQSWREKLGDIPTLIQTSLDIAVQEENLRKLKQVENLIDLLPPELQARVKIIMGEDATKAVQFFDFLAKAERVKHDLPINVQLEMDRLLLAGDVEGVQKLLEQQGFVIELPTAFRDPEKLDMTPGQVEAITGVIPLPTELATPTPVTPQEQAAIAASQATVTLPTNLGDPSPLTPEQKAVAAQESSVTIGVTPVFTSVAAMTSGLDQALELPPGVDLTDSGMVIPATVVPTVEGAAASLSASQIDAIQHDAASGEDRKANINVTTSGTEDADKAIDAVANKSRTATIHVVTDAPVPGGPDDSGDHKTSRSAPSVIVNQHITAGFGTDRFAVEKAVRKANHRLNRLAGIRA